MNRQTHSPILSRASGVVTLGPGGRPQIRAHQQKGNKPEKEFNPTIGDDRFRIDLRTDRSDIANAVLWGPWFCSSIAAQDGVMLRHQRNARKVAEESLSGRTALPNDAITVHTNQPADKLLETHFDGSGQPAKDAYTRVAEYLRVASREETATATTPLKLQPDKNLGRHFEIISFRWLGQAEVM